MKFNKFVWCERIVHDLLVLEILVMFCCSNWVCCSVPMSGEIGATCVFDMFVAVQSGTVLD